MTPPPAAAEVLQPRRTVPRRAPAPSRPRRVSGPARPAAAPRPARRATGTSAQDDRGLALSLPAAIGRLAPDRLLDRLIAGKLWIVVVAFALIGIVTLQLTLLKLNTSIGHALQREGALQRANAALSIENSELAAGERVESAAAQLGMQIVSPGALRFLTARTGGGDAARASHALTVPVAPPSTGATGAATEGSSTSGAGNGAAATTTGSGGGGETQAAGGSGSAPTSGAGAAGAGSSEAAAGPPSSSAQGAGQAPATSSGGGAPSTGGASGASSGGAGTEPPASAAGASAGGTQSAPTG